MTELHELLGELATSLKAQARRPNIYGYQPHEKQKCFHTMTSAIRRVMYLGGNRSGKSYGAVAEDIRWMLHMADAAPKDEPVRGRVVAVDYDRGVAQILFPIFKALCPPDKLKGGSWEKAYKRQERVLYFSDGGTIQFMSYEQSTEKFAGTSLHFVHYDEEPPKNIYNECQARLVDTNGHSWISMTPVEGMTWIYDELYAKGENSDDRTFIVKGDGLVGPVWEATVDQDKETGHKVKIGVVEVGMNENPHLSDSARIEYLASLSEDERAARSKGHFVQTAGKVFPVFQVETHTFDTDFDPKAAQNGGWQLYTSTDHGWNAPTAWLWHAVSPDGSVVTYAEHYQSHMTIEEHAQIVHNKEKGWGIDREEIIRTGDPAIHQHNGVTGTSIYFEYAKHGLYIYTESVPKDGAIGIGLMQQYFRLRPEIPTWRISKACPNFIKELRNLRWATYTSPKVRYENNPQEKVHKKDDHAFDSAKYFATFLPELAPIRVESDIHGKSVRKPYESYDEALVKQLEDTMRNEERTMWTTLETFT